MSNAWSWYVILGTAATLIACFWVVAYANKQRASEEEIAESESHVWDEDIRELNNPLPMWWFWLFILTVIWSALYLVYYPGMGNFEGTSEWSQEQQYEAEVAAAEAKYGPMFAAFAEKDIAALAKDPAALGVGASLYANYCSTCHGSTAKGGRGFPNLTDGHWLYGGEPAQIEQSIVIGRAGIMPALGGALGGDDGISTMVGYVQNMQDGMDEESPAHSQYMTLCIACHGPDGSGNQMLGSPSLIDDNWLYGSSDQEVRKSIVEGRNGVMPAHGDLVGADRARILAAYVYSLSNP
ncbi:MAG: cytochrome-c oxidase, cbb3-type subunit III [Woeseiaceae bacterium]